MSSEKKCLGCGVLLQEENILLEGYTTSLENDICQRCFRLKNYGEYQVVSKSNDEYIKILKSVSETKDLVLYITDLLNLEKKDHYLLVETDLLKEDMQKEDSDASLELQLLFLKR